MEEPNSTPSITHEKAVSSWASVPKGRHRRRTCLLCMESSFTIPSRASLCNSAMIIVPFLDQVEILFTKYT